MNIQNDQTQTQHEEYIERDYTPLNLSNEYVEEIRSEFYSRLRDDVPQFAHSTLLCLYILSKVLPGFPDTFKCFK